MSGPVAASPARAARLAVEVAPVVAVLGFLFWEVRSILSPLVAYGVLWLLLWPRRHDSYVARLLAVTGMVVLTWFLWANGALLAPFLLALVIAYLLDPAVEALARRRVPRSLAIAVTLLPFLVVIVLAPLLLLPALERQIVELAGRIPEAAQQLADWLLAQRARLLSSRLELLTPQQEAWLRSLQPSDLVAAASGQWESVARRLWGAFLGIGRGVSVFLTGLAYLIVTPVLTFYLLKAWPRFTARLGEAVPPARRADVFAFVTEYDRSLGRYVRGQLIEATLVGVLTGASLALLGFPGALLVGCFAGVFNLVPYVGLWISVVPGVLFALVSGSILASLLKLGAVFLVVQFIDGSITGPRIVGTSVGLNPVWVMVALALFGSLLGFVGLLVAVPLAVLVKMLAARAWARYQVSDIYASTPASG